MKPAHTQIFYCNFFFEFHSFILPFTKVIIMSLHPRKKYRKKNVAGEKNVVNLKNSICMEQYAYDFVVNRYSQIFMQNMGIVFDHIMAAPAWAFDELQLNLSDFTSCLRSSI